MYVYVHVCTILCVFLANPTLAWACARRLGVYILGSLQCGRVHSTGVYTPLCKLPINCLSVAPAAPSCRQQ